jgi:adenylyltransferase/sulfurtransferase
MNNYFSRQIELWTQEKQNQLQNKRILIVGCGGLGCSIAIALGASGIGHIDLIDFDIINIHNIHRQIGFTMQDIGKYKCEVLKDLLINRCPYVNINAFNMKFEDFPLIDKGYDLIIDATDNLPIRTKIDQIAKEQNIPWIYGSVENFHGQVCFFKNASFENIFNISNHKPEGIAAPIVMNIASLQTNLALRYLVDLSIKKDLLYYCFFNDDGIFEVKQFTLPT